MNEKIKFTIDAYIKDVYSNSEGVLRSCETDYGFIPKPKQISEYPRYIRALQQLRETTLKASLTFDYNLPKEILRKSYEDQIIKHSNKEKEINAKFEQMVDAKEAAIINDARKHNLQVKEKFNEDNKVYMDLEQKRKQLEEYSDEIIDLCKQYGITTSDITINNSSFTVEELDGVYDSYIDYMSKVGNKRNYVGKFRDLVGDNPYVEGFVMLVCLILLFTPVLDLMGILFFGMILVTQLKTKTKVQSYSILLGLLYNVQPLQMGFQSSVDQSLLVEETVDEEEDPEINKIADQWEQALDELDRNDPVLEAETILGEYDSNMAEVQSIFAKKEKEFSDAKEALIKKIHDDLSNAEKEFEELKANMKKLGDVVNDNTILNTKFKLGISDEVVEEEYDVGLQNMIIYPSNDPKFKIFINVLFANIITSVKFGSLSIYIYDPNNLGQDIAGFYDPEYAEIFTMKHDNLEDMIKPLKEYVSSNTLTLNGLTINEYNEEAAAVGKTPKDYRLLFVLSQPKTLEENEALKSFMEYSARFGVIVWAVMKSTIPNTKVWRVPYDGIRCPYIIDLKDLYKRTRKTLAEAKKASAIDGLNWLYYKDIANKDEDIWKKNTDKYIDIDVGFWEGDPTKYEGYTLGHDGDVHALLVGGTGAGKSVCMNQLIINMARKYSPRALELWLADYKGSEFQTYLATPEHPKVLPHLKACLCTSDGEYAGSLYNALRKEAERRYNQLQAAGCKDMLEYNKYIRKGELYEYTNEKGELAYRKSPTPLRAEDGFRQMGEDDLFSRILFINDEFQVIFEKALPKTVEKINKDITYIAKVARACGVHVLFGSQSLKGTVKKDTLDQFTLRIALRCDEDVSKEILGTTYAFDIKVKYGYLYVRSVTDKSLKAQKKFKTPYFAKGEDLRAQIDMLADRAKEEHMPKKDVIEYNELTKHYLDEVDADWDKARELLGAEGKEVPQGLMILGHRMTYSNNKLPDNVVLGAENNSHIMSAFQDTEDLVNFYRTVRTNIAQDPKAQVFVNSQTEDLHYVCEIDKEFPGDEGIVTTPKVSVAQCIKMFSTAFAFKKETGDKETPLYYILIGWDKGPGFMIDKNPNMMDELSTTLQMCGEYNMHFIFILTDAKGIDMKTNAACSYKVCGKHTEETSNALLGNILASRPEEKLKNGYMYINKFGEITKCKIYQSKLEREIKQRELIL